MSDQTYHYGRIELWTGHYWMTIRDVADHEAVKATLQAHRDKGQVVRLVKGNGAVVDAKTVYTDLYQSCEENK